MDKKWTIAGKSKDVHPQMKTDCENYLNALDPIFERAKEVCEFEFVLCLLGISGSQSAGWDFYQGLEDTFKEFHMIRKKTPRHYHGNSIISLFQYGLILEADHLYDFIANLLNVIEGDIFLTNGGNFPDIVHPSGKTQSVPPSDKINTLKSRAKKLGFDLNFYDEFLNAELRNAIFHSQFILFDAELRLPSKKKTTYSNEEWVILVNKAIAYHDALNQLRTHHIKLYTTPKILTPHHKRGHPTGEKATTLIREGHGVIGIKDTHTEEEINKGAIPFMLAALLPYEVNLVRKGHHTFPRKKVFFTHWIYNHAPIFIQKPLYKVYKRLGLV